MRPDTSTEVWSIEVWSTERLVDRGNQSGDAANVMTKNETEHVTGDGVRLAVEIDGPDSAPSVVLVHGLAASVAFGWRATGVLDRLGAAGLRTVAYDARGHGRSGKPHRPEDYGDHRLAADLAEVVDTYAGPQTVVGGYSMGSSTILFALTAGLAVGGAVLGATPNAVLGWSATDEAQRATAVALLEGGETADPAMLAWVAFLDAIGADKAALAALLRGHRPVVEGWDLVRAPVVVAAGVDDAGAAPPSAVCARLADARALQLPGDHISAAAAAGFTDAIIELASSAR
jgi:pimeloyl-ACP methyl ester carboxylesterase